MTDAEREIADGVKDIIASHGPDSTRIGDYIVDEAEKKGLALTPLAVNLIMAKALRLLED